jgi:hypothetical protein
LLNLNEKTPPSKAASAFPALFDALAQLVTRRPGRGHGFVNLLDPKPEFNVVLTTI